ncbi:hypothetical protein FVE85_1032 [Porphyridium purpureum]|uniref:Uncharacterized protein n=1 Tax=Porphyridium purpureum TaxID=35688 RepID=A0A5J4Z2Y9_PORPP|nr:hypothetical protein FVE85_1032 [Porphyridium purpureum]|eukprot:POR5959..scf208_2
MAAQMDGSNNATAIAGESAAADDAHTVDINTLLERLDKTFRENSERMQQGLNKMQHQLDDLQQSLQTLQSQGATSDGTSAGKVPEVGVTASSQAEQSPSAPADAAPSNAGLPEQDDADNENLV